MLKDFEGWVPAIAAVVAVAGSTFATLFTLKIGRDKRHAETTLITTKAARELLEAQTALHRDLIERYKDLEKENDKLRRRAVRTERLVREHAREDVVRLYDALVLDDET